ncbi:hypothetical protein BJF93_09280 [Xaviernesmea oryzae]|uniref:histidine kinase n=1 Tax=Xaviernesmea oryzae TaxID=464029 RepID=A0A1Q9AWJ3_9HYPH|nr:ATP-binding protein [Xaviernesmea oryzae]OLP59800.1 hypothetical protein BJF93_09280 [Xaviernesmea oryzae]SEK51452.1 PAS domain S-box-containing protein [Xaviernesmea oryzae]
MNGATTTAAHAEDVATSGELLQALFHDNPDPILVVAQTGYICSANPAALETFAAPSLNGLALADLVAPAPDGDEVTLLRRDGALIIARQRIQQVGDVVVHTLRDLSKAAPAGELRGAFILWTALQAITEGIVIYDEHERLVAFNEAYVRFCGIGGVVPRQGLSAREMMIAWLASGGAPVDADEGLREVLLERHIREMRDPTLRSRVMPYAHGRWMRVENIRTPNGEVVGIRADVTEQRETEMALERQRFDYKTLIEHIPDFIVRFAPDGTITFINDNFARFIARDPESMLGRPVQDYLLGGESDPLWQALTKLTPGEPIRKHEELLKGADGQEAWIFWSSIAAFADDHLLEYVAIGRDISELKLQQQRIEEQSDELQRKNDALGQFTGTVSHDLKAPLRHVSMFSEMMCEDIARGDFASVPVYADHLRQAVRRMRRLIDSLLEYARIADRIVAPERVSLREAVDEALVNLAEPIKDASAMIEIGELPEVVGDQALLARLCQNIIGNSVKYRRPDVVARLRIWSQPGPAGQVRLIFEDNGIGIDPRYAHKIFEVFHRLHRDESLYPGTGIGLALAQRVAESHRGIIELDATYTDGARFVVTLPGLSSLAKKDAATKSLA